MNENRHKLWTLGLGTTAVAVLVLAGLAGGLTGISGISESLGGAKPLASPVAVGASEASPQLPSPIKHVFLILMENEQTNIIYGHQPYQTSLANTYAWGGDANNPDKTGYYAVCHPSAPNYLALTSGKTLQCGSDSFNNYTTNNLGNLLQTSGESWIDYEESASYACQQNDTGLYVERHNPFVYYSDLGGDTPGSACMTHVVPIANLTNDYNFSQTPPAFTYIAPNILNDAHSSSAATGDWWLSTFIPKIIAAPWFSSTVVFIVYDEAYKANGAENYTGYDHKIVHGGPVYMVAVSPYTEGMGALTYNASHYNLLSTMEWLLGLPQTETGHTGTAAFPVLTSLFQPKVFGPDVDFAGTHLPGADLAGLNLQGDDLAGADLEGANLQGAQLQGADLQGAVLEGANLQGANLTSADLAGANLRGAQLQGAAIEGANLEGAILTGLGPLAPQKTNFDGADLYHAVLTDAVCGTPNYIVALGAILHAIGVPSSCRPPL